jgi:hypothetical protein
LFSKAIPDAAKQKKYDITLNANGGFVMVLE